MRSIFRYHYLKVIVVGIALLFVSKLLVAQDNTELARANARFNQGMEAYSDGKYGEAIVCFDESLPIFEQVYGKMHLEYWATLGMLGNCYSGQKNYPKAIEYHLMALEIEGTINGSNSAIYARILNEIGFCYGELGDYVKALEYSQQALEILGRVLGKDHPDYAQSLNKIGFFYGLHLCIQYGQITHSRPVASSTAFFLVEESCACPCCGT